MPALSPALVADSVNGAAKPKAALLAKPLPIGYAYDQPTLALLDSLLDLGGDQPPDDATDHDSEVQIILGSWGMPKLDERFFQKYPRAKIVFHAAGTVRGFMTDLAWERGVRVSSAASVNARPVADFAFAQIILSLKRVFAQSRACHAARRLARQGEAPGICGATVALLSLGIIGRMMAERLAGLEVEIVAYDPHVSPESAAQLGVRLVSLDEAFACADVVSCHTPLLPATIGLIRGRHLQQMKPGATFINTARGAIVAEDEMIAVLHNRPDLMALLDVTHPEPPAAESPLFTLPNVFLTPHISGSTGRECARMGRFVADEVRRHLRAEPLLGELTRARAALVA